MLWSLSCFYVSGFAGQSGLCRKIPALLKMTRICDNSSWKESAVWVRMRKSMKLSLCEKLQQKCNAAWTGFGCVYWWATRHPELQLTQAYLPFKICQLLKPFNLGQSVGYGVFSPFLVWLVSGFFLFVLTVHLCSMDRICKILNTCPCWTASVFNPFSNFQLNHSW